MYEKEISRRDPGCVVFLLDRSDSMKQQWGNSQETLAQGAARELNNILLELLFTSQGEPGKARHYFDVGVFGYGIRPMAGGEGVESAFGGKLAGAALVPLPELRDNPITVREVPSPDAGAPPSRVPIWVEAAVRAMYLHQNSNPSGGKALPRRFAMFCRAQYATP